MAEFFKETPEAITNTVKIAERCNLEIELGKILLPSFQTPDGQDSNSYLRNLVNEKINQPLFGNNRRNKQTR